MSHTTGSKPSSLSSTKHRLVIVSGYYGFGNLGDEAILEVLIRELKQLIAPEEIVVLSHSPEETGLRFGVRAVCRWSPRALYEVLSQARLFVSGGGGLFQDTKSLRSICFYAAQIFLARLLRVPCLIWAQGIGPITSQWARLLTREALSMSQTVIVRDSNSLKLVREWGIEAMMTADPVWCLNASPLAPKVQERLDSLRTQCRWLVGLSLRSAPSFHKAHLQELTRSLVLHLPKETGLILLPLKCDEDLALLDQVASAWTEAGRPCLTVDQRELSLPSQWLSLFSQLDLLVAMRLHALLMSLKCQRPVLGISYDPKVLNLLTEFDQPTLNLLNEPSSADWDDLMRKASSSLTEPTPLIQSKVEAHKDLACQNFKLLARILDIESNVQP